MNIVKNSKLYFAFFGLLFLLLFPIVDGKPYHLDLGVIIGIHSIIAMGLNILLGNTGQISLGQAAFYGMGAYASAILNVKLGFNFWLALPCAAGLAGLSGLFLGFTALRLKGHHLALVTLGYGVIFSIIISEWGALTGGTGGFRGMKPPVIGSIVFDNEAKYFYLVWTSVVLLLVFGKNIISMRMGRALSAIRLNETLASTIGINPTKYKLKVFALSGVYAGLAGSLYSHYSLSIGAGSFTLKFSIILLCMVVLGGLRSGVWGGILGAAIINLLPEFLRFFSSVFSSSSGSIALDYSYNLIGYGLLMIIFVLFLPKGIVGTISSVAGRFRNPTSIK